MKKIITAFSLCAVLAFFSAFAFFQSKMNAVQDTDHRSTPDVHGGLHSIYELNSEDDVLDSHSGVTSVSTLELDYRNSYFIKNSELTDSGNVWYPRIRNRKQ